MLKYKEDYYIEKPKDKDGNYTKNKLDNYIKCKNGQIYRYNENTLVVQFNSKIYANNRIKDLEDCGIKLKLFQKGNDESTYFFDENDYEKVFEIVKAKKRIKRELTEEQREVLKLRLTSMRDKMNKNKLV